MSNDQNLTGNDDQSSTGKKQAAFTPPTFDQIKNAVDRVDNGLRSSGGATPLEALRLLETVTGAAIMDSMQHLVAAAEKVVEQVAAAFSDRPQQAAQSASDSEITQHLNVLASVIQIPDLKTRAISDLAQGDPAAETKRQILPCIVIGEENRARALGAIAGLRLALSPEPGEHGIARDLP